MDSLTHYWNEFWAYFREGLNGVNPIQALVIALLGAMATNSFVGLFIAAALSVVLHLLVNALFPVIVNNQPFVAPVMDNAFWHFALALYILYFVGIAILYLIKLLVQHRPRPHVPTLRH